MHAPTAHNHVLKIWVPIAWVITLLCGLLFCSLQFLVRSEADTSQIQYAQDIATSLYNNETPSVNLSNSVDIEKSIAPFVVLYNSNGVPVDGTGKLAGNLPNLPSGVLQETRKRTEHRLTWQPNGTTRIAAVIRYYQNDKHAGYVLAGKNLRETEQAINSLLILISSVWAFALISSLVLLAFIQSPRHYTRKAHTLLKR
jgi:hypothetical protein